MTATGSMVWVPVGLAVLLSASASEAKFFPKYDMWIEGKIENRTGVFLNGGENFAGQESWLDRFEQRLRIDGEWRATQDLSLVVKTRLFIDNVFDVQDDDDRWSGSDRAEDHLQHSFELEYNDVLREAYIDYRFSDLPRRYGSLTTRIGKQQVVWGKSDGFRVLDFINPQDFRDPFNANFEEVRIPLWMLRLDYGLPQDVVQNSSIQVVVSPFYQQNTFPPGVVSPWSFRAFDAFQAVADSAPFRIEPNLFDETEDMSSKPENWEAGVRWSHNTRSFGYTLNYYYDWTNLPHARPQFITPSAEDPLGFLYRVTPDRVHRVGASFDYNFYRVPVIGVRDVVVRGELLGSFDDVFYGDVQPNLEADYQRDTFQYVLGIDKVFSGIPLIAPTLGTETFASFQIFQTFFDVDPRRDGLTGPNGALLSQEETSFSLFFSNTALVDRLRTELLIFYGTRNEWWFRPIVSYDISDRITAKLGGQFFVGDQGELVGEFAERGNNEIFLELGFQLF